MNVSTCWSVHFFHNFLLLPCYWSRHEMSFNNSVQSKPPEGWEVQKLGANRITWETASVRYKHTSSFFLLFTHPTATSSSIFLEMEEKEIGAVLSRKFPREYCYIPFPIWTLIDSYTLSQNLHSLPLCIRGFSTLIARYSKDSHFEKCWENMDILEASVAQYLTEWAPESGLIIRLHHLPGQMTVIEC